MSTVFIPCPLGAQCLSGTTQGHEPGSHELAKCRAVASGEAKIGAGVPEVASAYEYQTDAFKRQQRQIKRAWGADGRGIPNLVGPPGIGKSEMVENLARQMNADFMIFDVSSLDPDTFNGIPFKPEDGMVEDGSRVLQAGRLYEREVVEMFFRSKERPLIVFFDEINGGKEALMSSLQKVMTGRKLPQEGVALNDNVFMVAAMNNAEHTSNGTDLSAAMVSRLTPINIEPNFDEWVNGELTFWGRPFNEDRLSSAAAAMGEAAPTKEQYLEAATHVTNFLSERGNPNKRSGGSDDTLNIFSQPLNEDDLTAKVGQPRSWSKVISGIAAAIANREDGMSDTAEFTNIIRMNCGPRAARDFETYHEVHKDLPDMKEAFDKGTFGDVRKTWKSAGRADIPMFVMSVVASTDYNGNIEKMGRGLDLVGEIAEEYPDMAASRVASLVTQWQRNVVDTYGKSSDESKNLTLLLLDRLDRYPHLKDAITKESAVSRSARGAMSAEGVAVSAAKNTALDAEKAAGKAK